MNGFVVLAILCELGIKAERGMARRPEQFFLGIWISLNESVSQSQTPDS